MSDIRAGDVVVCVDDGVIDCGKTVHTGAWVRRLVTYRISSVQTDDCGCLTAQTACGTEGLVRRFRKIEAPKTKLSERIRKCRPIPVREDA